MVLSKRLAAIASFVLPGSRIADVGTDHAHVPIYLVKNKIAPHAVAMDVRSGPLSRAKEQVRRQGLEAQIELRLSDGLEALLPGEADTVIISGLGGPLMREILSRGRRIAATVKDFVLSPQSDIPSVRVFLRENGYRIEREAFLKDEGKYYTILRAVHGESRPGRYIDDLYGKYLLERNDPALREYLERTEAKFSGLLQELKKSPKEGTRKRAAQLETELAGIRQALRAKES